MKTIAVVVLLFASSVLCQDSAEDRQQRIRRYREECVKEAKVDPALIDKADAGEFADTKELKCFAKCFYVKAGFITEQGELLMDVVKAKLPPEHEREKALAIIELCKDLKGADACETAYAIHKCYFQNAHAANLHKN
uniref:Odorant binding protein 10 n=1 Tax=Anomala corpulenta TaxID=931571 RepID=A0A0A7HIY9_9SCAR|nr:odorant binding protein 7-like protein [Anomala corpulenta]AKC58531.1 odorant binding protein 10 [Anomala corpulenta]